MVHTELPFLARNLKELVGDREQPLPKIVMTILEAVDQDCLGHYRRALVLADTYVEHMMRYLLYKLVNRVSDAAAAERKLRSCSSIDKLLAGIAEQLGLEVAEVATNISFEAWRTACRHPRNKLTHDFNGMQVSMNVCRDALRQTIVMTVTLAELIAQTFDDLKREMDFFIMIKGYTAKLPPEEEEAQL